MFCDWSSGLQWEMNDSSYASRSSVTLRICTFMLSTEHHGAWLSTAGALVFVKRQITCRLAYCNRNSAVLDINSLTFQLAVTLITRETTINIHLSKTEMLVSSNFVYASWLSNKSWHQLSQGPIMRKRLFVCLFVFWDVSFEPFRMGLCKTRTG